MRTTSCACIMGEFVLLLMVGDGRARIMLGERLAKQRTERVALVVCDGDKAPRRTACRGPGTRAAIVRMCSISAARGTRADQLARLGRTAGLEQRQDR